MLASRQNVVSDLIREGLAQGAPFRFRVVSGSMAPLIAAGDEIVVEQASADGLRRGDIVLYAVGGAFHTHRLLAKRRRGGATLLVTKGDASLNPDQPWREEQLLGKVVALRRASRTVDLERGKGRAMNRTIGLLATLQVAAFRAACRLKTRIVGNRRTRWAPWAARIVSAPSRWLIGLAATLFVQVSERGGTG